MDWPRHKPHCHPIEERSYMDMLNDNKEYHTILAALVQLEDDHYQEKVIVVGYNFLSPGAIGSFYIDHISLEKAEEIKEENNFDQDTILIFIYFYENYYQRGFELDVYQERDTCPEEEVTQIFNQLGEEPPTKEKPFSCRFI